MQRNVNMATSYFVLSVMLLLGFQSQSIFGSSLNSNQQFQTTKITSRINTFMNSRQQIHMFNFLCHCMLMVFACGENFCSLVYLSQFRESIFVTFTESKILIKEISLHRCMTLCHICASYTL